MPRLIIPRNQQVKAGELFTIIVNDIPIRLEATHDIRTASYDVCTWTHEFDPIFHGFYGMNVPICLLLTSFAHSEVNDKVFEFIIK